MVTAKQLRDIADSAERTQQLTAWEYATVCRALAESIERLKGEAEKLEKTGITP